MLALSMIHTAQAQVGIYKSSGFGAIKKEKKQRVKRTYEWENMILLNYAFTTTGKTHNVGFTYARCKEAGFYVDAMVVTYFQSGVPVPTWRKITYFCAPSTFGQVTRSPFAMQVGAFIVVVPI